LDFTAAPNSSEVFHAGILLLMSDILYTCRLLTEECVFYYDVRAASFVFCHIISKLWIKLREIVGTGGLCDEYNC